MSEHNMRMHLANQALKELSREIGSSWVGASGFGGLVGDAPTIPVVEKAEALSKLYARARFAFAAGDYLEAIRIATEVGE